MIKASGKILKMDPSVLVPLAFNSVLPEDDWFADVSHIAMKMLTGKGKFGIGDRDITSPTASVSAQSVSSVLSHGSS
ncbi:hypothetical protein GIB67_013257 [Kingdonia uniflora]|uniref:Uncharacterized protein n=1 Tax=Kingdonia uniflora TaxID=39325 RepID=A0A7J7N6B6_9MAGN|nr:hypothetical protein GIB67_013257 [Kingdonia uniflora]